MILNPTDGFAVAEESSEDAGPLTPTLTVEAALVGNHKEPAGGGEG